MGFLATLRFIVNPFLFFQETPKYKLAKGDDEGAVANIQRMAKTYNRECSLTLEALQACGTTNLQESPARKRFDVSEIAFHVRGLFQTRDLAHSTLLLWLSWALIGLAYPLFNVFLPTYLASRGAQFNQLSADVTWRNYAIVNVCSIFGPLVAGLMAATALGRKYTMVIGALATMAFSWAYSTVKSNEGNVAFACMITFTT